MSGYHIGINLGHDRSVAVVRDGEIKVAIEQERLDRIKHSVGFMVQSPTQMMHIQVPGECIRYCLDALGLTLSDIEVRFSAQMTSSPYLERFVAQLYAQLQPASSKPIVALPESLRMQGFEKDGVYEGVITGRSSIGFEVELAPGCIGFLPRSEFGSS